MPVSESLATIPPSGPEARRQRIAVLAGSYLARRDGISVYIENLVIELVREALGRGSGADIEVFGCGEALETLRAVVTGHLGESAARLYFHRVPGSGTWAKFARLPRRVARSGPFDLVVLPNLQPLLVPGRKLSILHDLTYQVARGHFDRKRFLYMHWLTLLRLRLDEAMGTISQTTHMHLLHYYPQARLRPSPYLPNGLPRAKLGARPHRADMHAAICAEELQILFCGRLNRLKGIDRVLAFASSLDEQAGDRGLPPVTLHLVGKATDETEALFAGRRFRHLRIVRHGFVSDAELNRLYRDSGFALFLSRNEGFGLPLIEAIWMGAVPLVSDIEIFAEVLGAAYPRFDEGRVANNAMLDFIERLRDEPHYREQILEQLDQVLTAHRDGYRESARTVLDYACSPRPAAGPGQLSARPD